MSNEKNNTPASPYPNMVDGVIGRDTSIACPTRDIIGKAKDLTDRVIEVSAGPRPIYYGGESNPYEVFKVLEAWGLDKDFYLGNVIKYVVRSGKKHPGSYKEDLQKAVVYLQKRIDSLDK
jgi:hypothetical protein